MRASPRRLESSWIHYDRAPDPDVQATTRYFDMLCTMGRGTLQVLVCDGDDRVVACSDDKTLNVTQEGIHVNMRYLDDILGVDELRGKEAILVHKESGGDEDGRTLFRVPLDEDGDRLLALQDYEVVREDKAPSADAAWFHVMVKMPYESEDVCFIDVAFHASDAADHEVPHGRVTLGLLAHLADLDRSRLWARARRRLRARAICVYWFGLTAHLYAEGGSARKRDQRAFEDNFKAIISRKRKLAPRSA